MQNYRFLILLGIVYFLGMTPVLFPTFNQLNLFDECFYAVTGWLIWEGQIPPLSYNPFLGLMYSLVYPFIEHSPLWMLWMLWIGKILVFTLHFFALYRIAHILRDYIDTRIIFFILCSFPILQGLLSNPSDSFFSGISILAMSYFFSAVQNAPNPPIKISRDPLTTASTLISLSTLCRLDGFLLFGIHFLLTALILKAEPRRLFLSIIVPYLIPLALYLLLFHSFMGNVSHGIQRRSYVAFAQGEGMAYQDRLPGKNPNVEGELRSQKLYGSAENNRHSILRAVANNPIAYVRRVLKTIQRMPQQLLNAYGFPWSIFLFSVALWGWTLLVQKWKPVAFSLVLWQSYLATYLLTFYREGYFLFAYVSLLIPASIALQLLYRRSRSNKFLHVLLLILLGVIMFHTFFNTWSKHQERNCDYEEVIYFLTQHFDPYSRLCTYSPGPAWASRMEPISFDRNLDLLSLPQWLKDRNVKAILIDEMAFQFEPHATSFFLNQIGKTLVVAHTASDRCYVLVQNDFWKDLKKTALEKE